MTEALPKDYVTNPAPSTDLQERYLQWLAKEEVRNAQPASADYRAKCFEWALETYRQHLECGDAANWNFGSSGTRGSIAWRGDTVTVSLGEIGERGPDVVLKKSAVARADNLVANGQVTLFD
jgi:hypothetical protein